MSLVSPRSASTDDRRLPAGWRQVRLDGFCRVTHGGTPSKDNSSFWAGNIPWVSPKDMRSTTIEDAQDHISEEAVRDSATNLAPPGSILAVVRSGILARTAPIAVTSVRVAFNQDIKSIEADPAEADVWFLYWMLKAYEPVILSDGVKKGATVHSIRSGFLESLEIPLPLLDEQQRIANVVGEQMAAVERARAAAEVQVEAAKALPAAYLRTVFESATAQAWPTRTLAEMSEIVGGIQKSPDRVPVRLHRPYLTVRNVQRGCLDLSEVERFEVTPAEIERLRLLSGDILVVEGNGSIDQIGRNAIFIADGQEWIHQNHIIRVRLDGVAARPEFLSCFLNCDLGRAQMVKKAETTSGLYTLSAGKVASLEVPVPSLPEQDRLLSVLGEHMGQVERLMGQAGEKLAAINSLPAALLRRAFSGEL